MIVYSTINCKLLFAQGKGKKRQLGWFPASYVKLMESAGEKAEVPVQSTTAPSEAEKPAENKDPEPQATTEDPSAGVKVRNTSTYNIPALDKDL